MSSLVPGAAVRGRLVYNFNHNFPKINLDSSFGFSRRAAETAEYAEKVPKTEAFRSPHTRYDRKRIYPKW